MGFRFVILESDSQGGLHSSHFHNHLSATIIQALKYDLCFHTLVDCPSELFSIIFADLTGP